MRFAWIAVGVATLGLAMAIEPAFAGDKQGAESMVVRAKVVDGTNLQGCRFVDTVFGQGGGGMTSSQSGIAKALLTAKADASENAIALGANSVVFTGIAVTLNYYVVMANAYLCPA